MMAELENRKQFAELLYFGIFELRQHPDYKTKRKGRGVAAFTESYIDKIAFQLGVSTNTLKSWMGQMGEKYIPGRIEDSKLFGLLWLVMEKGTMDTDWFAELLETTSIPVIRPPLPVWVTSCFQKARICKEDKAFGVPEMEAIDEVVQRLFANSLLTPGVATSRAPTPIVHNLPMRSSDVFIGRRYDLLAILEWLNSSLPVALIKGLGGMGKSTLALEVAYACVGDPRGEADAADLRWPRPQCLIWVSAELKNLTFADFLDTIAYQLGRAELLDKSMKEKRFVVRQALADYSEMRQILFIIDSIDTADREIQEFLILLPQGVKVLLTAREDQNHLDVSVLRDLYSVHLQGLTQSEALEYIMKEIHYQIRMHPAPEKKELLQSFLAENRMELVKLIDATAGNPKALSLCIAYMMVNRIPVNQLILEIQELAYSLGALFDYLFGSAWKRCSEDARTLWQVLSFYGKSPTSMGWAAVAGLDSHRFYAALEQLRSLCLIESERVGDQLCYRAHQTVLAYAEHHLLRNPLLDAEARGRWSRYYIDLLDTHIKRDLPSEDYWNCLLGRNLDIVKQEWPNIFKLMQWVCDHMQYDLLIELVLRLTHFLSRVDLQLRIEYGFKAAEAAKRLGKRDLEALFRIDTIGWALNEMGDLEEGARQIELGLSVLKQSNPGDASDPNLEILGRAFLAKSHLRLNNPARAAVILKDISSELCMPVIKHRVLLTQGDYFLHIGKHHEAVHYYEKANELSNFYGGEKTIEAYYYLGLAYIGLGDADKAEATLEQILYNKVNPNPIELIYYTYGKAQLSRLQDDPEAAVQFAEQALSVIDSWDRTLWLRQEVEQFCLLFPADA